MDMESPFGLYNFHQLKTKGGNIGRQKLGDIMTKGKHC